MFTKLKASLGIGAAKVDTIINNPSLYQGETIIGQVQVTGGDVDQEIDSISLQLCTEAKVETDNGNRYEKIVLGKIRANSAFTIEANQIKSLNFSLPLPLETPITHIEANNNQSYVWIETSLDIRFALDPKDRDFLEVNPIAAISYMLEYFQQAGFTLAKADVEKGFLQGGYFASRSGCYQEFEFKRSGFFNGQEIELSFVLEDDKIHCLVEIDGSGGREDSYKTLTVSRHASRDTIFETLEGLF